MPKARYKTYHLDAWKRRKGLHSFMNKAETNFIDYVQDPITAPEHSIDHFLALRLSEVLREPGSKFILVEKFGVHAPTNPLCRRMPKSYRLPITSQTSGFGEI